MYGYRCECGRTEEHYVSVRDTAPTWKCEECGADAQRDLTVEARNHVPASAYPYVTKNLNGRPIEVKSAAHLRDLCKQYGKVLRDDAAFIDEDNDYRVEPGRFDRASGRLIPPKVVYLNGSGRGNKGSWY
jgi:hypothetical protein